MAQPPYQQQPPGYQQGQGYGSTPQPSWGRTPAETGPWTGRQKIAGVLLIVAAVLGAIGAFLPWASINFEFFNETVNGFDGSDGYVVVVAALVAIVFGALSFMPTPPRRGVITLGVITGLLLAYIGFWNFNEISGGVDVGIGLWLVMASGILVLAGTAFMIAAQAAAPKELWPSQQAGQYGQQSPYQAPAQPGYQQPPGGYQQGQGQVRPPGQQGQYQPPPQGEQGQYRPPPSDPQSPPGGQPPGG
jgi:hypothetical protein